MISEPTKIDIASPLRVARPRWAGALAGIVAGSAALAVGELVAALSAPKPGPIIAVSNRVIDQAPPWFVDFGKSVFGLGDKLALIIGTLLLSLLFAAILGVLALKRPAVGAFGIAVFGVVGFLAIGVDAQGGWIYGAKVSALAVVGGVAILVLLLGMIPGANARDLYGKASPVELGGEGPRSAPTLVGTGQPETRLERRTFIGWLAGAATLVAGVAFTARELRGRATAETARSEVDLVRLEGADQIEDAVTAIQSGEVASTPGIAPLITPNEDFYLIDTATLVPQVDPENWTLTIRGMVDNETVYTYADLLARAETIAPVTLSCVSNDVGGGLVGNAIWQGVPLSELLDEAGVQAGATQIRSESVDGWDCGFPTDLAFDGRTALVAIAMNGEPLPVDHGFPARLVISGLYGYVSATKWLKEIELTTLEDFDGYWIPRGWSKEGPIKTQSRIDTPRNRSSVQAGTTVPIAGVAWAPNIGIERVEVQIDDGAWTDATLGESLGINSWRQWSLAWQPTTGDHILRVRATDATGETQTSELAKPAPNGASGWHTISVNA